MLTDALVKGLKPEESNTKPGAMARCALQSNENKRDKLVEAAGVEPALGTLLSVTCTF